MAWYVGSWEVTLTLLVCFVVMCPRPVSTASTAQLILHPKGTYLNIGTVVPDGLHFAL